MQTSSGRADALAVRVRWGDVRVASHVVGPRARQHFSVGPGHDDVTARGGRLAFSWQGDGARLTFGAGVTGTLEGRGGQTRTLSDLVADGEAQEQGEGWSLPVRAGGTLRLAVGDLSVEASTVRPPRWQPLGPATWDFRFLNVLLSVGLLALLALARIALEPRGGDDDGDDLQAGDLARMRHVLVKLEQTPPPVRSLNTSREPRQTKKKVAAAPEPAAHGASHAGRPGAAPVDFRNLMGTLLGDAHGGAGVSAVFGRGGLGQELGNSLAQVVALGPGGGGGLSLKGGGGGGGDLGGPLGIGAPGLRGKPNDVGSGVLERPRSGPMPQVYDNGPVTCAGSDGAGCLDKEMVRRVIRQHLSQVRYCYEQALQRQPHLMGKVVVAFEVARDGSVGKAVVKSSTLGDSNVGECLVSRVLTWRFPASKSMYGVSYPFVFQPAGG